MGDESSNGSPLGAVSGVAGSDAADAFELLGDETRLAILLALWEARDPVSGEGPLTSSDLYDRIDYDHAGNFSYHLEQLFGQFVRRPDGGTMALRSEPGAQSSSRTTFAIVGPAPTVAR